MKIPCYNTETQTDCPKRHSGCAVDCPEWAAYCEERDKDYEKRAEASKKNLIMGTTIDKRTAKKLRRMIDDRITGFTK